MEVIRNLREHFDGMVGEENLTERSSQENERRSPSRANHKCHVFLGVQDLGEGKHSELSAPGAVLVGEHPEKEPLGKMDN